MGISPVLEKVHRPHAAHVMHILHEPAAWGVQSDFAAVSSHPAATWSFPLLARTIIIVIDTVVVLTQHRQIRWLSMTTILVSVDVVDLAPIGGHIAIWPRTDEIFRHGQGA